LRLGIGFALVAFGADLVSDERHALGDPRRIPPLD
jgi:hypothetical protein